MYIGMTRRSFLGATASAVGGLATLSIISGCTPQDAIAPTKVPEKESAQPTSPPPMQAKEKLVLRVQMEAGPLGAQMGELCDRYMQQYPDVTVKIEDTPWADLAMKTELGYATGDLPDSLFSHTTWHHLGCHKGWYRKIDDLLDTGVVPDYDDFYEVAIENQKFEGGTYGLLDSAVLGPSTYITWNRNLFEAAGVEPPKPGMDLWELNEMARKVANPDAGEFGIQMVLHTAARLEVLARCWGKPQYGANGDTSTWLTSPDGKKFNFLDNVGVQEIFTNWYTPLVNDRIQPKNEDEVQGGLFVAGKLAIYQGHHGHPQRFKNSVGDNWDYHTQDAMYLPTGPEGRVGSSWHCHVRCVSGITAYPQETLELAAYLTSHEAQMIALTMTGNRGCRKSVYGDPSWHDEFPHYKQHDEILQSGAVEPFCMPWNLRVNEFDDTYNQLSASLVDATASWAEQGPLMQKEITKIFDLPRP